MMSRHQPRWHIPLLLILLTQLLPPTLALNEEYCFADEDPSPDLGDCWSLLNDFAHPDDTTNRIFLEEQLREAHGIWPGLARTRQELANIIQLPRVFSRRSCNIMLTSYAGEVEEVNPISTTNFQLVNQRGDFLLNKCMAQGYPAAGVATIRSNEAVAGQAQSALTIWIWGTGSYWDYIFDSYMSHPGTMIVAPMGHSPGSLFGANGTMAAQMANSTGGVGWGGGVRVINATDATSSFRRPAGSVQPS